MVVFVFVRYGSARVGLVRVWVGLGVVGFGDGFDLVRLLVFGLMWFELIGEAWGADGSQLVREPAGKMGEAWVGFWHWIDYFRA